MSLSYRKRGKLWYCRGTVRVGLETITVGEFNTGCASRQDAEAVGGAQEAKIRRERLDGPQAALDRVTIGDAIETYLNRRKAIEEYDVARLADLNPRIGHFSLAYAERAWQTWLSTRGAKMAPATQARWRATLQAAINAGAKARSLNPPVLSTVKQDTTEKAVWLTKAEQERLLAAYVDHVKPIALTLCFQGTRSSEALRIEWRHIDFERNTMFIAKSKNGRQRTIPMHPRVATAIKNLWIARRRPEEGPVFLSRYKAAYTDTTKIGGNPLTSAHRSACKAAGIKGFTPHGWRHHWASWMVMTGCDLVTLMSLGGWRTQKMVTRYAAVSADHKAEAILRLT